MRIFMCAIDFDRVFHRSAAKTSSNPTTSAGCFRVLNREQFEKMTSADELAAFEARRSSYYSSSIERPQFFLFCGSDTSASPMTLANESTRSSRPHAPAPAKPSIDHRMPVFFMPPLSPACPADGVKFVGC
ncbi:hypothetical protein KXD40_000924 [Peronospora effusa]|uniref:Uncharacterized protein n=1 Tax=Peronospora effusa TaxID=542832 RepID=A0A3M6VRE2_9STRA|nr:hypothetical protein DD238_005899 [Peronospora effusa]RQM11218.1 hypothetical protein DD237_004887 [Peronospora effusa]UIZ21026.1 hypothetical protein KXD40_000924 [Peronospora effusa]